MYIKICEICGKPFNSTTKHRKTCGEDCRLIMLRRTHKKSGSQKRRGQQICVNCQRATGKRINSIVCPWARSLTPVKGWEANKIILKDNTGESYDIISCPLFLHDEPRKISKVDFCGRKSLKDAMMKYQGV